AGRENSRGTTFLGTGNGTGRKGVTTNSMARKKAATATVEAPQLPLEELIKKLIERGKKRASLTYEEINAVFDNVEDVTPERVEELFEEIASLGIEIVEE